MKNFIFIFIIFLVEILCCQKSKSQTLSSNLKVQEIFTENEISSLNEILEYFDSLAKKSTDNSDIEKVYHSYCENLRDIPINEIWKRLRTKKNEVEQFIKSIEDNEVYGELWIRKYTVDYENGDTLGSYLIQNTNGKFIELLNYICAEYPEFYDYREAIIDWKFIPPGLVIDFQSVHQKLDFNQDYIRLFVAIHYITLHTYGLP